MEDYLKTQKQKSEEKLSGELTKLVTSILLDWAKQSHDPEFKKMVLEISNYSGQHLWRAHGEQMKRHLVHLSNNLIHEIHGTLHHGHEAHTAKSAENVANDIWSSYL